MSRRRGRFFSGQNAALHPWPNLVHLDFIQRPGIMDTPLAGKLHKESLSFFLFAPQSLANSENQNFGFILIRPLFQLFTVLPFISNAYKMLILTPI